MTPNPSIECAPLDERGLKAQLEFKEKDAAAGITAYDGITYPIDKRRITPLEKGDLFYFIGDFAVDAFNKSHQMYVNKNRKENIHEAQFLKCYYHKLSMSYLFHMTIEAIEQGYAGSYEATVECESDDGAITLDLFILMDRKPSHLLKVSTNADLFKVSTKRSVVYETVKDRSSDPEVYYDVTGMVGRTNGGGGYDVHNPNGYNRLAVDLGKYT